MAKQTLQIISLKDKINASLTNSKATPEFRRGLIFVLENVLHSTGNYDGFKYLTEYDIPKGELPGVRCDLNGNVLPYEQRFKETDDTRRYYY